jgi:hypothetical protein
MLMIPSPDSASLVKVKGIATPQGSGVRVKEGRVRVRNFVPLAKTLPSMRGRVLHVAEYFGSFVTKTRVNPLIYHVLSHLYQDFVPLFYPRVKSLKNPYPPSRVGFTGVRVRV